MVLAMVCKEGMGFATVLTISMHYSCFYILIGFACMEFDDTNTLKQIKAYK